ncbi:MAG: MFS transporter [Anaerolineae bacterium]|nr:MFS transporter [Anaerolineae bacterium]
MQTKLTLHQTNDAVKHKHSKLITGLPFYYGWIIFIVSVIGKVMTSPGQTYAFSIFIERFIEDLAISRSVVSTLYTFGTLTASLTLPFLGRQIDRRGPRVMVSVISIIFAVACLYMSFVQNAVMLGIGFAFMRMLGQGGLNIVSGVIVNQWWVRKRGMVLGLAGVLTTLLGSGMFPSFLHLIIGSFGWRSSYRILALMLVGIMLPVGFLFYRGQPEEYGLLPDGDKQPVDTKEIGRLQAIEENWTSSQAIRTAAFWIISLGLAAISMLGTGLQFHMVSIFQDAGLDAGVAASAYMSIAVTGAIFYLIGGILVDRIPVRYVLCAALIGQTTSLLLAPRIGNASVAFMYGVVLGITGSLQMTVSTVVWAKYFGRKYLGSITGIASLLGSGSSALGPMPMGIARDLMGSYTQALTMLAILPFVLSIVVLFARRPQKTQLHQEVI